MTSPCPDGKYGAKTRAAFLMSPCDGFPIGPGGVTDDTCDFERWCARWLVSSRLLGGG